VGRNGFQKTQKGPSSCRRSAGVATRAGIWSEATRLGERKQSSSKYWGRCSSICDGHPSYWNPVLANLVGLRRRFSGWERPSSSTWLLIIQFPLFSHSHFQDRNPYEVAVLAHIALACKWSGSHVSEGIHWCRLCPTTDDTWG
jgi:hypothetical protein